MDRQYKDQKETWTDITTTKGNMDRQYNDQRKHGQAIQRPKETWTDNTTTKRNTQDHNFTYVFKELARPHNFHKIEVIIYLDDE
jgi:hypothetical protein